MQFRFHARAREISNMSKSGTKLASSPFSFAELSADSQESA
jgi:hypothetical protein